MAASHSCPEIPSSDSCLIIKVVLASKDHPNLQAWLFTRLHPIDMDAIEDTDDQLKALITLASKHDHLVTVSSVIVYC